MRRRYFIAILFCLSVFWTPALLAAEWPGSDPVVRIAADFIDVLDQGDYERAWGSTSKLFQALNEAPQWQQKQKTLRNAYGPSTVREFRRLDYRTSYAFSPDGHYCIVQFNSSFQNKAASTETIVLVEQPADNWLVREYVLR